MLGLPKSNTVCVIILRIAVLLLVLEESGCCRLSRPHFRYWALHVLQYEPLSHGHPRECNSCCRVSKPRFKVLNWAASQCIPFSCDTGLGQQLLTQGAQQPLQGLSPSFPGAHLACCSEQCLVMRCSPGLTNADPGGTATTAGSQPLISRCASGMLPRTMPFHVM